MTLESTQMITYSLIDISAVIAAILAMVVVWLIYKKEEWKGIKKTVFITFLLLAIGLVSYTVAEIMWSIISWTGGSPALSITEYFWIIGSVLLFSGFMYFAVFMCKVKGETKKCVLRLVTMGAVAIAVPSYLVGNFIIGFQQGESAFEIFLDYFYPISSALILIASLSVYSFFKKAEELGKPLLYLAISAFFLFLGDMFYTYYSWNDIYGITGLLSDSFYAVQYILAAIGFYLLFKLLRGTTEKVNGKIGLVNKKRLK